MSDQYGSTRKVKLPAPLREGYFRLDNRRPEEFLKALLDFSAQVQFGSKPKINWKALLESDISFILADILTQDSSSWVEEYPKEARVTERKKYLKSKFEIIRNWQSRLERYQFEEGKELEKSIRKDLDRAIEKIERLKDTPHLQLLELKEQLDILQARYRDVEFPKSLQEKDDHQPHLGLLLASQEVYRRHYQEALNGLPYRLLDFYYSKVLRQDFRPAIPDQVYVAFEPAAHIRSAVVPKGTVISGGRDEEGEEILFEMLEDIPLSQARISAKKTVFFGNRTSSSEKKKR